MIRDPKDMRRYTASERANHWVIGISFILLGLSGLPFFHPAFYPLTLLFGGPVWTRILHPFFGVLMAAAFLVMFIRFVRLNLITAADMEWVRRVGEMVNGNDENMPEQGKYNGGQKLLFWAISLGMVAMTGSGIALWRAYFDFGVGLVRFAAVVHAIAATLMIAMIFIHIYTAIWVKGTIRAMWYGTVTRSWAKQHHRGWYRQVTGK